MDYVAAAGLFLLITGFIIGLGAVTVIDLHGFLARHSSYWTEATIRAHKVTKPLIWIGMCLGIIGGFLFYQTRGILYGEALVVTAIILLLNGSFLTFYISPKLLQQEREGRARALLPKQLQQKITVSFVISFFGWWTCVMLVVLSLL